MLATRVQRLYGRFNGVLYRPAPLEARSNCAWRHSASSHFCRLSHGHALAHVVNVVGVTIISHLRAASCPATVARFVIPIVVDAFNRVSWRRPWPHIVKKCREAGQPSLANSYASPSIIVEVFRLRVSASGLHANPSSKLNGPTFPMGGEFCGRGVSRKATARFNASGFEVLAKTNLRRPAVAHAIPRCLPGLGIRRPANNNQAMKTLASYVNQLCHGGFPFTCGCGEI